MNLIKRIYDKYPEELVSIPPGEISIFHVLSEYHEEEMFIDLIEKFNVDVNSIPLDENESIVTSVCVNRNLKLMNYFLRKGIVFDTVDAEGYTLLHHLLNNSFWYYDDECFEKIKHNVKEVLEFVVEMVYSGNLECFFVANKYGKRPIQSFEYLNSGRLEFILNLYPELGKKIINLCVDDPDKNRGLLRQMFFYYFAKK